MNVILLIQCNKNDICVVGEKNYDNANHWDTGAEQ